MTAYLSEVTRELPLSPVTFGVITFIVFTFMLYVVLRLDK
jgi:hypothetical protein